MSMIAYDSRQCRGVNFSWFWRGYVVDIDTNWSPLPILFTLYELNLECNHIYQMSYILMNSEYPQIKKGYPSKVKIPTKTIWTKTPNRRTTLQEWGHVFLPISHILLHHFLSREICCTVPEMFPITKYTCMMCKWGKSRDWGMVYALRQ